MNTGLPLQAGLDAVEELRQYKTFLALLDEVASLLLAESSPDPAGDALALILEACDAELAALYLDQPGEDLDRAAAVHTVRIAPSLSTRAPIERLCKLRYADLGEWGERLAAGMLVHLGPERMLPQLLEAGVAAADLLVVPLLRRGEATGFVALLSTRPRQWHRVALSMLCAVINDLALSLERDQAAKALSVNQQRLQALVGATEDVLVECDYNGRIRNLWSHAPAYQGIPAQDRHLAEVLPASVATSIAAALPGVLIEGGSRVLRCTDDTRYPASHYNVRLQAVPDAEGVGPSIVVLLRDTTTLVQEELRWQTMLKTLDLLDEAVIELTASGILLHASTAWATLRGESADRLGDDYGYPLSRWVHPQDRPDVDMAFCRLSAGESQQEMVRFRLLHEPEPRWVEARLLAQRPHLSAPLEVHGVLRDITAAYQQERRIMQMALYDALTGLPNRLLLDEKLNEALARARRNQNQVALGFIDLDHFKLINDSLGHKAGDAVLVELSKRLKSVLREVDTLARWGGDEFVVLLPDLQDLRSLSRIAERLREVARQGIAVDGLETKPSISIGLAVFPEDADSADGLLSVADHTLFYAKGAGRNNVQFYRDVADRQQIDRQHVALQGWFTDALAERSIQMFLQPVVELDSGRVVSFEALARWYDDRLGWVSPGVFVPMAEKMGLIRELGEQVIDEVLRHLSAWRARGLTQPVAVNVARPQLFSAGFVEQLIAKVAAHGLSPSDLIIEITESTALADISRQTHFLEQLEHSGFAVALDDFGTGYSALSQLHEMPIRLLKIDPSFTAKITTERGRRIVQAIVQMADALGLTVIAEGVEDESTVRQLASLGIRRVQGHWFSEAVPAGLAAAMLESAAVPRLT